MKFFYICVLFLLFTLGCPATIVQERPWNEFIYYEPVGKIDLLLPTGTHKEITLAGGPSADYTWSLVSEGGYYSIRESSVVLSFNKTTGEISFTLGTTSISAILAESARIFDVLRITAKNGPGSPGTVAVQSLEYNGEFFSNAAIGYPQEDGDTFLEIRDFGNSGTLRCEIFVNNIGDPGWLDSIEISTLSSTTMPEPGISALLLVGISIFACQRWRNLTVST